MQHRFAPPQQTLRLCSWAASIVLCFAVCRCTYGQQTVEPRQFAPGVFVTIPAEIEPDETVSTHDLIELRADLGLRWQPNFLPDSRTLFGMAEKVKFRRAVWCLQFSFKPVRMIEVDIPQADGQIARERIWYLVYKVANTGMFKKPVEQADGSFVPEIVPGEPVQFIPSLVLEAQDRYASGDRMYKAYLDQVIPAAVEAIRRRETPGRQLLNSADMAAQMIPVSDGREDKSVWGVATWADVDPRIDFFSVYVSGLSNAYRWVDPPGAYQTGEPPGTGRMFARKTLQLNFWRPGDEYLEHEEEIRFGVPPNRSDLYDVADGVAFQWVYR